MVLTGENNPSSDGTEDDENPQTETQIEEIEHREAIHENGDEGQTMRELKDRGKLQIPDWYNVYSFAAEHVPKTYGEALKCNDSEKWKLAMIKEMDAHKKNNTWTLVERPSNENVIGCKWVYTLKTDGTGKVTRYKARLVAKGCSQKENRDFFDSFAPVVRYESIRILLALAARENFEISQFDVKTAFLYGDLKKRSS